ncbi:flagellar motor protein MotB [Neptuniibacter sp. PT34_22]|uniref:OmpA/MotB family protein n=1 Tax=Neptuniibacter sp. PT34_22 TaxID=3398205 RepID=UPI0039F4C365
MRNVCKRLLILMSSALMAMQVQAAGVSEVIYFIQENGEDYVSYTTTRTRYSSYNLWLKKQEDDDGTEAKALADYLYIFPKEYRWNTNKKPSHNIITFSGGDFALMKMGNFRDEKQLTLDANGTFQISNWDGKTKNKKGRFGKWNTGGFDKVAMVFVMPQNLEVVSHKANREGQWVQRNNSLAFYADSVNDLVFDLQYRHKSQKSFTNLKQELEGVEVAQTTAGVKLTLGSQVLFASGSSELSAKGVGLIEKLAAAIKQDQNKIVVAGHTDNVQVKGALTAKYPTNWELSSARALSVLHKLVELGVAQERLQARAFADQQPVADNSTVEGRAKNRRIEVLLVE